VIRHDQRVHRHLRVVVFLPLLLLQALFLQAAQDVWKGVERVVAVGDVHGDYEQFVALLRSANLIDPQGKWSGGKTHLVQTGDVLDRGPDSRKVMDLLIKLEKQAGSAGGHVHALIGNHEAMNIYGDLRYVPPGEYAAFRDANSEKVREALYLQHRDQLENSPPPAGVPTFDDAYRKKWESEHPLGYAEHRREFSPAGKYGKWIRSHNTVIKIDDTLFLHGGIAPKYAALSIREINETVRDELEHFIKLQGGMVTDGEGPLWYRGLAQQDEQTLEPHLRMVLDNFKVERIVIGHTPTEGAVTPRFGGKVLLIDIGLSRVYDSKLRSACLLIENGKPYALHRGKRLELPSDSRSDLLRYLKQAAALDPPPSSLGSRISDLEAQPVAPVQK
jgi:Calcineurin-like phosphoesterase